MTDGYIICYSNEWMPNILKIAMTETSPELALNELNKYQNVIPAPYKIELAKKVLNPKIKEADLYTILSRYTKPINQENGFFNTSIKDIKEFFNLMDGDEWTEQVLENDDTINSSSPTNMPSITRKCFTDGQRIRHIIGEHKIWSGVYDYDKDAIILCSIKHEENGLWKCVRKLYGEFYLKKSDNVSHWFSPIEQFVREHYQAEGFYRDYSNPVCESIASWIECKCMVDGKWVSTNDIKRHIL